jgi:hypothetical protein
VAAGDETQQTEAPRRSSGHDDTLPASSPPEATGAARATPPPGERYRLGAELGRGGMGRVVEAFDVHLGRTVALKEVSAKGSEGVIRRFKREIEITARLEHASIVPLYDSGTMADGRPFYVMRKVTGRPLDELISRARGMGERLTLLPHLLAAMDAIAHAHRRGIIHRDLKPANILVGDLGETVVIDWGLAKVIGEDEVAIDSGVRVPTAADSLQTQVGSVFGTPGFMPPEQARGDELGPRSDVFALGATLYQLLAGAPPHQGKSATEMIEKTFASAIVPVATIAPGAPPELVAIVDKALEFEPENRYANAAALGEDVRRFLDGQLVAAHQYTRRERVARFARRHRAVLSVVALAAIAVAVLAWISVSRVVAERDAAQRASEAELTQRRVAESALEDAKTEREGLIIENARNRLDAQPTEAAAMLKQIPPSSKDLTRARGIALAASARGVAWALQTPDVPTTMASLDLTGRLLVQVTFDGMVRVYDLEVRRAIAMHQFERFVRAHWIAGGKLLVLHERDNVEILDPITGVRQKLAATAHMAFVDDAGARAIVKGSDHHAAVLDVMSMAMLPLAPDMVAREIAISPDGTHYAVADDKVVVIYDRDRREVARHQGHATLLAFSTHHQLAVLETTPHQRVFEITLDAKRLAWTEVPIANLVGADRFLFWMQYRGRDLVLFGGASVYVWDGVQTSRRLTLDRGMSATMTEAWQDVLAFHQDDTSIRYIASFGDGTIEVPSVIRDARLVGRRGQSRLVTIGRGLLVGFDLEAIVPEVIVEDSPGRGLWIDDQNILLWVVSNNEFEVYNVAQRTHTKLPRLPIGVPVFELVEIEDGRVLITSSLDATSMRYVELSSDYTRVVVDAVAARAKLVPGGTVIFTPGDSRLMAVTGEQPAREIAKLDGQVLVLGSAGRDRYVALSAHGELVRGSLATGEIERVHVELDRGATVAVAGDRDGRTYVATRGRLLVWDKSVRLIDEFRTPVRAIIPTVGGVLVELTDYEIQYLELGAKLVHHRVFPPGRFDPWVSRDGRFASTTNPKGQAMIAELPSLTQWTFPLALSTMGSLTLSPNGRRLIQTTANGIAIWTVPKLPTDLQSWLDERTNATIDADRKLAWPWQQISQPAQRSQ